MSAVAASFFAMAESICPAKSFGATAGAAGGTATGGCAGGTTGGVATAASGMDYPGDPVVVVVSVGVVVEGCGVFIFASWFRKFCMFVIAA